MSFIEEFIVTFFQEVLYNGAKKTFRFVLQIFKREKKTGGSS